MSNDIAVLTGQLEKYEPRLARVVPGGSGISAGKIIETVIIACERTPKLLQCTRESLMMGAMTIANWGLVCDGITGQAYLIPRNDRRAGMLLAQPQPGYKGIITMCGRSGWILSGQLVRQNDPFRLIEGSNPRIEHDIVADQSLKDRGRVIGAYAVGRSLKFPPVHWYMNAEEIEAIRNNSQAFKSGGNTPWKTDPAAMWLKTPILHLGKRMPIELVNKAAVIDERSEMGQHAYMDDHGTVHVAGEIYGSVEPAEPAKTVGERLEDHRE